MAAPLIAMSIEDQNKYLLQMLERCQTALLSAQYQVLIVAYSKKSWAIFNTNPAVNEIVSNYNRVQKIFALNKQLKHDGMIKAGWLVYKDCLQDALQLLNKNNISYNILF
jgi:hypothetical protein